MKTLTFRLTLWYAFVVTITVALILWAGRYYLKTNLIKGIDFLNTAEFEEIIHRLDSEISEMDAVAVAEAIRLHTEIDASVFYFQVGKGDGEVLFRSSNLAGHTLPEQVHGHKQFSIRDDELGHLRVGEFDYNGMDIHIASSLQSVDAIFQKSIGAIVWILSLVLIISLVVGVFLSRVALNPINNIQIIARRISAQNLKERIPVPNQQDELSELSTFLNEMFDRLETAFNQISRFTADASHELRTPLSLIRLHSERLISNPDLPEVDRIAALAEQMNEIEHLNKLIDDLLFIAKADAGVLQLSSKSVDLKKYLDDFKEDAVLLCEEQSVMFELIHASEDEVISFDPVWMRHVFLNLLNNALRVSPEGSVIRLYSKPAGDRWSFILEDEGPGLDEKNLELMFDRFQRHSDGNEEVDSYVGTGLGLAICRSIVSKHDGSIFACRRDDHTGLQLHVELPKG